MRANLTQKEQLLLQDQKNHEQICIQKYESYSQQAQDPQLKQLFQSYAQQERQHLNTLNQILSGKTPQIQQQSQQAQGTSAAQQSQQMQQNQQLQQLQQQQGQQGAYQGASQYSIQGSKQDASLCNDMLMTEKYVASTYNTAVFEFTDPGTRQALNHILTEEQQHGEGIYNYLNSIGMYNTQ